MSCPLSGVTLHYKSINLHVIIVSMSAWKLYSLLKCPLKSTRSYTSGCCQRSRFFLSAFGRKTFSALTSFKAYKSFILFANMSMCGKDLNIGQHSRCRVVCFDHKKHVHYCLLLRKWDQLAMVVGWFPPTIIVSKIVQVKYS